MPHKITQSKENYGKETALIQSLKHSLIDAKASHIKILDVQGKSNFTNWMIVATATSNRHAKALADRLEIEQKKSHNPPMGVEGHATAEWILVDFFDVIVHIMLEETRSHYNLEKMWSMDFKRSDVP